MTVTATRVVAEDDGSLRSGHPFLDSLVARLHEEFGVDPERIRRLATELLGAFSTARVQAFVPILVEKRLRESFRGMRPAAAVRRP